LQNNIKSIQNKNQNIIVLLPDTIDLVIKFVLVLFDGFCILVLKTIIPRNG